MLEAGGSVCCTLLYALTYEPKSHTFVGTQCCQLYQHDVLLIQLAALGSYILGGVEEVEHQWADRVLEHLNNAGGKQRVVQ